MEDARRGFVALQNHGLDPADIRLGGPRAEIAEEHATHARTRDRIDHRLAGHVARRVAVGAIGGALAGAAIGIAAAVAVIGITGLEATGAAFATFVVVLGTLGSILGVFLTFERSVGVDDTWQLTLDDAHGDDVLLAVRVRNSEESGRVIAALDHDRPESIQIRRATPVGVHIVDAH